MSLPSNFYSGSAVNENEIFAITARVIMGSTALLAYSQVISFDRELKYVWNHLSKPVSWLFILIRYPALLTQLINASLNSYTPRCNEVARLSFGMEAIALIAGYAFQILRTQAILGSGALVPLLLIACLPAIICEIWTASTATCATPVPPALRINIQFSSELVFESLVLAITIWRTRSLLTQQRILRSQQGTVALQVLSNEILYYSALILCDTGELVANNIQTLNFAGSVVLAIVNPLNFPLRWSLLSHAILELQEQVLHTRIVYIQEEEATTYTLSGYPTEAVGRFNFSPGVWKTRNGHGRGVSSQNEILLGAVTSLNSPCVMSP